MYFSGGPPQNMSIRCVLEIFCFSKTDISIIFYFVLTRTYFFNVLIVSLVKLNKPIQLQIFHFFILYQLHAIFILTILRLKNSLFELFRLLKVLTMRLALTNKANK